MPILDESVVETGAPRLHCAPSLGLRPSPQPSSATERRSLRGCGVDDPKEAPIETSGAMMALVIESALSICSAHAWCSNGTGGGAAHHHHPPAHTLSRPVA